MSTRTTGSHKARVEDAIDRFYRNQRKKAGMKVIRPRKNRLRVLREERKLTQLEVAKMLDIDNSTVSNHESARRGLTAVEIEKYAKLFKVASYELFIEPANG